MTIPAGAPVLRCDMAVVRPLARDDAAPLVHALSVAEVTRFIHPPPASVEGFRRYVGWATKEGRAGRHIALAVVPHGSSEPVGLFQIRRQGPASPTAEWGFALAARWWGTGLFMQTAPLVVRYAFDTLGVGRLEARAAVCNGRGNGALAKVGAVCEAVLTESFVRLDQRFDEVLWTIATQSRVGSRPSPTAGDRWLGVSSCLSPPQSKTTRDAGSVGTGGVRVFQ